MPRKLNHYMEVELHRSSQNAEEMGKAMKIMKKEMIYTEDK